MSYERRILIGDIDYSHRIDTATFSWVRDGGCDTATLHVADIPFDLFDEIGINDIVEIRYGTAASTCWWYGLVHDLETQLPFGLTILCVGAKLKLGEIYPLGRYGTDVDVITPTGLTYLVYETAGELAAGSYTYRVSAIDDEGETLASSTVLATVVGSTGRVALSWAAVKGASGYRVYRGTANPFTYWQTSEIIFEDDGTSAGTSIATVPASDTATAPTISSAFVDDALTDLLTTYLPEDLSIGDITAGDEFELDDYDLGDGSGTLLDVLGALSDIVGDVVWGVDENGEVYFVPEAVDYTKAYPITTGERLTADVITAATRRRSRDGVTAVRVVGEDDLSDGLREAEIATTIDPADDWPDAGSIAGKGYVRTLNYRFGSKIGSDTGLLTEDNTQLTAAYASVSTQVALVPELAALKRVALKYDSDTGAYVAKAPYTDAIIAKQIARINDRIRQVKSLRGKSRAVFENMERRRQVLRYLPGVKTPGLARIAASNFTNKYAPVADRWSVTIMGLTELIKPGIDMLRITTPFGESYDLAVQSANYQFDDVVICSLELGIPELDPDDEAAEEAKVVRRTASKEANRNTYFPYVVRG